MSAQKMTLVKKAPVNDPGRKPQADERNAKQRRTKPMDINARDNAEDRVWGVHTRARWGGEQNLAELHADSMNVDRLINGEELLDNPHGGEGGEGDDTNRDERVAAAKKLKVDDLRDALTAAEIEFDEKAKKEELAELYVDNNLDGGDEDEGDEE